MTNGAAVNVSFPNTFSVGATGVSTMPNLVLTAYDKLIRWKLRSQPLYRSFADTRPTELTNPGSTVRFQMVNGLTPVLTTLNEYTDTDPVALGGTTTLDVSANEWGNAGLTTRRLQLFGLADVDQILAHELANNMADTIDIQAQLALNAKFLTIKSDTTKAVSKLTAGSGVALTSYSGSTAVFTGSASATSVAGTDLISSNAIRYAVTKLRATSVSPTKGTMYGVVIHPEVAVDLRQETGAAAWRDPHVYSAPDAIMAGELGAYEGAYFIENPRAFNGQVGSGTGATQVRVYNTFVLGQQVLAEAVAVEPHMTVGPVTDQHGRFHRIGWYGVLGWGAYRTQAFGGVDAAVQILSASSVNPNA